MSPTGARKARPDGRLRRNPPLHPARRRVTASPTARPTSCGLKILAGLHEADGGTIKIGNARNPFDPARDIGMLFQQALLLKWRTVPDNVLLPTEIVGLPVKAARARARDLLHLVGLAGHADKYPQQLSGGMQQRAAIARAFVHDPKRS